MLNEVDLPKLNRNIVKYFNESELKTLSFEISVDYESLPAVGKADKARELVAYCQRHDCLDKLIYKCLKLKPNVPWGFPSSIDIDLSPPFKGLAYFKEEDSEIFFGRQSLIDKLIGHVYSNNFLAIVGASGSGKSSVVRAGLIPAIRRGYQVLDIPLPEDCMEWPIHVITPTSHPLDVLAETLNPNQESIKYTTELRVALESEPQSLRLQIQKILIGSQSKHLLLVIDQFEELFTLCGAAERKAFLDCIFATIDLDSPGNTIVVIVLRADFYINCLSYMHLSTWLERKQIIVTSMSTRELRQAIEEPANHYSITIEPGLTEELLDDIGDEPGALPLLSHALFETWKYRDKEKNMLTHAGYLKSGGIHGAIANTANTVFKKRLLKEEHQIIVRNIFLSLLEIGEDTPPTRKPAKLTDLMPNSHYEKDARQILQILIDERLLTVSSAKDDVLVEVSHEALLREWGKLDEWLAEYHEQLRLRRLLSRDAREWKANNQNISYLYSDDKLAKVKEAFHKTTLEKKKIEDYAVSLNELEESFLEASIQSHNEKKAALRRQRIRLIGFVILIFIILGFSQINWYEGQWEKVTRINGGNVTAIAINPNSDSNIFVAVAGKDESVLFKSNDGGNSWIRLDQGLHKIKINDILIDPETPEVLYLATEGGGVFKSTDGGNTWASENTGLRTFTVQKLIFHPFEESIYLATYGRDGGVYRSDSDSLNWQLVNQGLPSPNVIDLSINSEATLFVATEDDGVYISKDGGQSWETTTLTANKVRQIVIDPLDPLLVYVGTKNKGLFKSIDGGMTWQNINNGLPDEKRVTAIEISPYDSQTVYLTLNTRGGNQFYISRDQGNSWNHELHPGAGANVNGLIQNSPNDLLIISEAGLFKYDEINNSSHRISIDYYQVNATDIAFNSDSSTLYVSVNGGIFHSQDSGKTWSFANKGLTHPTIRVLAPDPIDEYRVYAGTYSDRTPDVIFVSTDRGITWQPLTTMENVLPDDDVHSIVINPLNTKTIYVGTFGSGVFKSINQGGTWIPINSGIIRMEIIDLKMDPTDHNIIYAIAAGGPLYKTVNGGEAWQVISETANKDIRDIIVDGAWICIAVYGQEQGNLQCSEDSGSTWRDLNKGLTSRFVNQLEISAVSPDHLYAGTADQGIFISRDKGQNWQPINNELANGPIKSLIVESNSETTYSIIESDGVFTYQEKYFWER